MRRLAGSKMRKGVCFPSERGEVTVGCALHSKGRNTALRCNQPTARSRIFEKGMVPYSTPHIFRSFATNSWREAQHRCQQFFGVKPDDQSPSAEYWSTGHCHDGMDRR